ncbi:MAG: branched-chain amino acid ABC transporter permease [Chloroflexi bacterium]|nr:branched-chain amino acid ABC transporter permease [Chloroflexota bacterium]
MTADISFPLDQLPLLIANGLIFGCIYGVNGIGFGLLYNATTIVNFTQGEFVVLGGMITYFLWKVVGLPLPVAMVLAVLSVMLIGVTCYGLAIRPLRLRQARPWTYVFMLFAVATILATLTMLLFGDAPVSYPAFWKTTPWEVAGLSIAPQGPWIVLGTIVLTAALDLFFRRTLTGKAMKAVAINSQAAAWLGISPERIVLYSFALTAGLGAITGILLTPLTPMQFNAGLSFTIKGFAAAIIGGYGSFTGALLGGLIIGILESLTTAFFSAMYHDALTYALLLFVLFVKPSGILTPLVELQQEEV